MGLAVADNLHHTANEVGTENAVGSASIPKPVGDGDSDMPKAKSTKSHDLDRVVVKVHAKDFILARILGDWSLETTGIFSTLAALSAYGPLPADVRKLAALAQCQPRQLREALPHIEKYFIQTSDGLVLAESGPMSARLMSVARPSLRHLFRRLAAFWGRACVYCGVDAARLAIEHIVPVARGGGNDLSNLTLACQRCNSRKGTKTAAEFGFPAIHERAAQQ